MGRVSLGGSRGAVPLISFHYYTRASIARGDRIFNCVSPCARSAAEFPRVAGEMRRAPFVRRARKCPARDVMQQRAAGHATGWGRGAKPRTTPAQPRATAPRFSWTSMAYYRDCDYYGNCDGLSTGARAGIGTYARAHAPLTTRHRRLDFCHHRRLCYRCLHRTPPPWIHAIHPPRV